MNSIMTIIKKEFLDIVRDRKTLIMTIVIPVVLMPLLFSFIFNSALDQNGGGTDKLDIIVQSDSQEITDIFKSSGQFNLVKSKNPKKAVDKGDAIVYATYEDEFTNKLMSGVKPTITLYYDTSSTKALSTVDSMQALITSYQNSLAASLLQQNGIPTTILEPVNVVVDARVAESDGASMMLMGMLVPLMVVGYAASGIISIATDLGAGEKERGTLEPLLATSVSRSSIFLGKLIVISFFGVLTSILSAVGLFVMMNFTMSSSFGVSFDLSIGNFALIVVIAILYVLFISAIMLLVSTYARSSKEAGTYLTPCTLIPMLLSIVTMYQDTNAINPMFLHIPIMNTVTVIKEIVVNQLVMSHLYITMAWAVVYIVIAYVIAKKLYDREEVIFRT